MLFTINFLCGNVFDVIVTSNYQKDAYAIEMLYITYRLLFTKRKNKLKMVVDGFENYVTVKTYFVLLNT